jgi:glycopeptide antibiotics resistance protein
MRLWRGIFLGWVLLIIITCTFPWLLGPPRWSRISWIPFLDVFHLPGRLLGDAIPNFFLYVPLGFWYVKLRSSRNRNLVFHAGLLGLLLSGSCEFYQVFSPHRFPSMTDVFTNTIGALAGASIAAYLKNSNNKLALSHD